MFDLKNRRMGILLEEQSLPIKRSGRHPSRYLDNQMKYAHKDIRWRTRLAMRSRFLTTYYDQIRERNKIK